MISFSHSIGLSTHLNVQYRGITTSLGPDRMPEKKTQTPNQKGLKKYSSTPILHTDRQDFFWKKTVTEIFFSFLDNQAKHFAPCVVKPQNLSYGVTWDGASPQLLRLTCPFNFHKALPLILVPYLALLAPNALSSAFSDFLFFFCF